MSKVSAALVDKFVAYGQELKKDPTVIAVKALRASQLATPVRQIELLTDQLKRVDVGKSRLLGSPAARQRARLVRQRRTLLDYLKVKDRELYEVTIKRLGISD